MFRIKSVWSIDIRVYTYLLSQIENVHGDFI